ncbi:sulfotransferase [Mesobacterium pallidum]|uniref:sulfotransferase n=1 Tax=Mesobacterium pallidum TaxID=2872037 RepID=UPI001EE3492B
MSDLRVINLGLPKTGTTTLATALRRAGLKTAEHKIFAAQTSREEIHGALVAQLMYLGLFNEGDPLHWMPEFAGFAEISVARNDGSIWPQMDWAIISAIGDRHPSARFVATRRPTPEVVASMNNWYGLGSKRLPNLDVPGLPRGFGSDDAHKARWIDGHYAFLARVFAGDDRYLELDVAAEDAAQRLAAHIGRDVPWWGRRNVNHHADEA